MNVDKNFSNISYQDYCQFMGEDQENCRPCEFFVHQEPERWFSLFRDEKRRITVNLPSEWGEVKRIIYIFRNSISERVLIGKTGRSLSERCAEYMVQFNREASELQVAQSDGNAFLRDVKKNPEHFTVGILYRLKSKDDLDIYERCFIDCKRSKYKLYNDRRGGGGGLTHAEESPVVYAVPKPGTTPYTPEKYYPYKNQDGNIRPQFTPGVEERIQRSRDEMEGDQQFVYAIKKVDTQEYYVGVTGDFKKRAREHGYAAEYCDPQHDKFEPNRTSGCLHVAMAENPEQFAIGMLPVKSGQRVDPEDRQKFIFLPSITQAERYSIDRKQSLVSQGGFNCYQGGGGPIPGKRRRIQKGNSEESMKRCMKRLF